MYWKRHSALTNLFSIVYLYVYVCNLFVINVNKTKKRVSQVRVNCLEWCILMWCLNCECLSRLKSNDNHLRRIHRKRYLMSLQDSDEVQFTFHMNPVNSSKLRSHEWVSSKSTNISRLVAILQYQTVQWIQSTSKRTDRIFCNFFICRICCTFYLAHKILERIMWVKL